LNIILHIKQKPDAIKQNDFRTEHPFRCMAGTKEPEWPTLRLRQIRFVPFDIGTEITKVLKDKIHEAMSEKNYKVCDLVRYKDLLPKHVCAYTISDCHQLFIFKKGICVSVLTDESQDSDYFFSINCCLEKRDAHRGILKLDKNAKEKYRKDGEEIRELVQLLTGVAGEYIKGMRWFEHGRKKTQTRWKRFCDELDKSEKDGLSYVMTMHVITPAEKVPFENLDWEDIPEQLRKNIKVLLDPAIINMEDARDFDGDDIDGKRKLFDNIDVEDGEKDYEKRENLSMFMSWSSVVVLGMPTENDKDNDIEEYKMLEAVLQSNWHLVHCREKALPASMKEAKERKITSSEMRMEQYDLDRYLEETTYHSGSTLPARFNDIQKGLLRSSRLSEKAARYGRMTKDMSDSLNQLRQSVYGRISGILLLIIAGMNASSIIFNLTNIIYVIAVSAILIIVVAVGAIVMWLNTG